MSDHVRRRRLRSSSFCITWRGLLDVEPWLSQLRKATAVPLVSYSIVHLGRGAPPPSSWGVAPGDAPPQALRSKGTYAAVKFERAVDVVMPRFVGQEAGGGGVLTPCAVETHPLSEETLRGLFADCCADHVIDRWQSLRAPCAPPPSRGADRTQMDVNAEQYGKFMAPAAPLRTPLRAEEVEEALAQHAAAIEEALGVRCIDPRASPELYMWAPDLEGALAGEEAAARVAERRVVEWECRARHRFGASVQCLMAQVQRGQPQASRASARWTNSDAACPVCEAADLGQKVLLEAGVACESAEFVPRSGQCEHHALCIRGKGHHHHVAQTIASGSGHPVWLNLGTTSGRQGCVLLRGPRSGDQARVPMASLPIAGGGGVFKLTFCCRLGHRWQTSERLFNHTEGGRHRVRIGKSELLQAGAYNAKLVGPHACCECKLKGQRDLLQRAASSYYGSRDPGPSPTNAAAECERLLKLDRDASAWAVLGLTRHDRGAARQRYHVLARLLHPDKCSQRGAADAFKRVADAFRRIDGSSSF